MTDIIDYILDGLEAELTLERELGIRLIECDRELLIKAERRKPQVAKVEVKVETKVEAKVESKVEQRDTGKPTCGVEIVFLHHAPLSPEGRQMIDKIVTKLGLTSESAPVIHEKPVPKAKAYVILGKLALTKFQPNLRGAPGQKLTSARGATMLVTYSPEYILRFKTVTPAVQGIKLSMWRSLKDLVRTISML